MRRSAHSSEKQFLFVGNHLCLDLINTEMVEGGRTVDRLSDFGSFINWFVQAQTLELRKAEEILRTWGGSRDAERVLQRALGFRASLREMAGRIVNGKTLSQAMIDEINEWLAHQAGRAELERTREGFEKRFQADFDKPAQLLWLVAESASDLLCYADLSLVKRCENAACVLFFYDTTKNHSRRWCSMSACGNRMKVAAHYQRLRDAKGSPPLFGKE
jgi:predicted RNA-binding Zn ribbon-like protein